MVTFLAIVYCPAVVVSELCLTVKSLVLESNVNRVFGSVDPVLVKVIASVRDEAQLVGAYE